MVIFDKRITKTKHPINNMGAAWHTLCWMKKEGLGCGGLNWAYVKVHVLVLFWGGVGTCVFRRGHVFRWNVSSPPSNMSTCCEYIDLRFGLLNPWQKDIYIYINTSVNCRKNNPGFVATRVHLCHRVFHNFQAQGLNHKTQTQSQNTAQGGTMTNTQQQTQLQHRA